MTAEIKKGTVEKFSLFQTVKCWFGVHVYKSVKLNPEEIQKTMHIERTTKEQVDNIKQKLSQPDLKPEVKYAIMKASGIPMATSPSGEVYGPSFDWQAYECECCGARKFGSDAIF